MSLKSKTIAACHEQLDSRIAALRDALSELTEGAENDSKSSAGDKHETARAMMQLEHEKISKQLNDALEQKSIVSRIDEKAQSATIGQGSLVKTNKGYLFLCAALGKVKADGVDVMTLSIPSPLGQKLFGLKAGQATEINSLQYIVEEVL